MTHCEVKNRQRFLPLLDRLVATEPGRLKHHVCALIDRRAQSLRTNERNHNNRSTSISTNTEHSSSSTDWFSDLPLIISTLATPTRTTTLTTTTTTVVRARKRCAPTFRKKPVWRSSSCVEFACEWPHCGRSFRFDYELAVHERIHLQVRPFSCAWPQCHFDARQAGAVLDHIRRIHFRLRAATAAAKPRDRRNWTRLVRVNTELATVRLHAPRTPPAPKPFHCTWPECRFSTEYRSNAVTHVRRQHFGLPVTVKEQRRRAIVDYRRPNDYIRLCLTL